MWGTQGCGEQTPLITGKTAHWEEIGKRKRMGSLQTIISLGLVETSLLVWAEMHWVGWKIPIGLTLKSIPFICNVD